MTPGILELTWTKPRPKTVRLGRDHDGWRGDAEIASRLDTLFPASGAAGTPWVQSFYLAVAALGARVIQHPVADPTHGTIH